MDNCQVGVFLAYAARAGYAPLDRRLYLPKDWAADKAWRQKCHVSLAVKFQEKWQIALDLLDRSLTRTYEFQLSRQQRLSSATQASIRTNWHRLTPASHAFARLGLCFPSMSSWPS